jgi:hypothetical protein
MVTRSFTYKPKNTTAVLPAQQFTTWGDFIGEVPTDTTGTFHIRGPLFIENSPYSIKVSIIGKDNRIFPIPISENVSITSEYKQVASSLPIFIFKANKHTLISKKLRSNNESHNETDWMGRSTNDLMSKKTCKKYKLLLRYM